VGDGPGRASKESEDKAAGQRTAAERRADAVLAREGDERTAAEIRLALTAEADLARAVLTPISKAAAGRSMSLSDRMSLGYAEVLA
jgi:hypothetical protein